MKIKTLIASAAVALGVLSAPAMAVPIKAEGTTDVTVSDTVLGFLAANSIAPSPIAPATASGATFSFPITGGETTTLEILHSGGLRLEAGAALLDATDFVIDGTAGTVAGTASGSAIATPTEVILFNLSNVVVGSPITADLLISDALNGALGATFAGGEDLGLTGVTFGSAVTDPSPVPLPAAAWLLIGGLGALGAASRRRAKKAA